jgi:hypothetical protein
MGTGLVPSVGERVERSAPAWVEVTEWHICDGSVRHEVAYCE